MQLLRVLLNIELFCFIRSIACTRLKQLLLLFVALPIGPIPSVHVHHCVSVCRVVIFLQFFFLLQHSHCINKLHVYIQLDNTFPINFSFFLYILKFTQLN